VIGSFALNVNVVAGGHHLRVERHLDHHVGEGPRHEPDQLGIVVLEVVAPPERVVHAASIEARDVAFVVAGEAAEEVDLLLRLAAVLARQHAAGRDADRVEVERVGSDR
jgi:hypothetical protein